MTGYRLEFKRKYCPDATQRAHIMTSIREIDERYQCTTQMLGALLDNESLLGPIDSAIVLPNPK